MSFPVLQIGIKRVTSAEDGVETLLRLLAERCVMCVQVSLCLSFEGTRGVVQLIDLVSATFEAINSAFADTNVEHRIADVLETYPRRDAACEATKAVMIEALIQTRDNPARSIAVALVPKLVESISDVEALADCLAETLVLLGELRYAEWKARPGQDGPYAERHEAEAREVQSNG